MLEYEMNVMKEAGSGYVDTAHARMHGRQVLRNDMTTTGLDTTMMNGY